MSVISGLNYFQIGTQNPTLFSINQFDLAPIPITIQNLNPGTLMNNKKFGTALLGCRQTFRAALHDDSER